MPSLGGKTVRALLKGANDGAPRTQVADLQVPKPGQLAPEDASLFDYTSRHDVVNNNFTPQTELEHAANNLPWKRDMGYGKETLAKTKEFLALYKAGDIDGLNLFSRQQFGMAWRHAKITVERMLEF